MDSLNNQLAAQQTLINKLTIDTEQRVVLYKALEELVETAAQQDVAHKINTLGNQVVDTAADQNHGWYWMLRRSPILVIFLRCMRKIWFLQKIFSAVKNLRMKLLRVVLMK